MHSLISKIIEIDLNIHKKMVEYDDAAMQSNSTESEKLMKKTLKNWWVTELMYIL